MPPLIGEIRMFAGNFAPAGWAFCDGSLVPISENDALFILIGTTYGGDGQETFALPDLRGRFPLHPGVAAYTYALGDAAGSESVTLTTEQIPSHTHAQLGSSAAANEATPPGNVLGTAASDVYVTGAADVTLAATAVDLTGGGQPHENLQPYLCVNFIISLYGEFPQQY